MLTIHFFYLRNKYHGSFWQKNNMNHLMGAQYFPIVEQQKEKLFPYIMWHTV